MSTKLTVELPTGMEHYEGALTYFVATMVAKLYLNRHKGFAENMTPVALFNNLEAECAELREALLHKDQFSALVEAADVANMAFLTGLSVLRLTRQEYEAGR
jgi:hypothetical protein